MRALGSAIALAAVLLLAASSSLWTRATASLTATHAKIAFEMSGDAYSEIYVMNADGSGQQRLTRNRSISECPAWSPDGRRIAFARTAVTRAGLDFEIYVMNADGSGQRRLAQKHASSPAWSPDGRRIAFERKQIYVINAAGSGQRRLTRNRAEHGSPAWSPDGRRIAFGGTGDGNGEIYVINADGSGQRRLTRSARLGGSSDALGPAWSPDGRRIAFERGHLQGNSEIFDIYVINADGSGQRRLTRNPADEYEPSWSPDGRKIAYLRRQAFGGSEIYVMNADGSGQRNLTRNPAEDASYHGLCATPAWSPDGRKITFGSNRDGNFNIYVMNADGSGQRRLSRNRANEISPAWSP